MDPMQVLAPNFLGYDLQNTGIDSLTKNVGFGVNEVTQAANPGAAKDRQTSSNPAMTKLRIAKAKEFGKSKEQVGF